MIDIYGYSNMSFTTFVVINVSVSLLASQAVYYLIEKPIRKSSRVIVGDLLSSLRIGSKVSIKASQSK